MKHTLTDGPLEGRSFHVPAGVDTMAAPNAAGLYVFDHEGGATYHPTGDSITELDAESELADAMLRAADVVLSPLARAIAKAAEGYRVLIVTPTAARAGEYFRDEVVPIVEHLHELEGIDATLKRANGAQRVSFASGGFVKPVGLNSRGGRGIAADVLGLVEVNRHDPRLDDVLPSLAASTVGTVVELEPFTIKAGE